MSDKLKPCPFCGKKAKIKRDYDFYSHEYSHYVICWNKLCSVSLYTKNYPTKSDAIAAWNARAEVK